MKKVLIAIDYSPSAEKVAQAGYSLARKLGAEVCLIHVITEAAYYAQDYSPIMGYEGSFTKGTLELVENIKTEAESFLASSVRHLGDPAISTMVLQGDTKDAILKYSIDWGADLVVLGSHSLHGLNKLFGTDVATYVLTHSKIPLLAIPTDEK